jgi:hypothetical protein
MLEDLFTEIEKNHIYEFAINSSAIDDLEKKLGCKLPQD